MFEKGTNSYSFLKIVTQFRMGKVASRAEDISFLTSANNE